MFGHLFYLVRGNFPSLRKDWEKESKNKSNHKLIQSERLFMKHLVIIFVAILLVTSFSLSQDKPAGKVHGYVFGDYYYVAGADTAASRGAGQYSSTKKDFQGFQFRRVYLYYEHNLSEQFFAQFLLEGNDKTFTYDDKAGDKRGLHSVFIKTAYLEWKDILTNHNLAIGLVPTPTWSWSFAEKTWNYRSIEKTITDFRGLGGAVDIGISMRGKIDDAGTFGYVAMIGNGQGAKAENNKYKKFYGQLNAKPTKELLLEGYVDFEPNLGDKNKTTLKGFAAYQTKEFTIGAEVVQQTQAKVGVNGADIVPFGLALFAWAPIPGVDGLNAFGRFDYYDPNTKVSDAGYKENFFVVGVDYMPIKDVHIMPNVWVNTYSNKKSGGPTRHADVVGRLTFFYVYK